MALLFGTKQIRTKRGELVYLIMEKMRSEFEVYKDSVHLLLSGGNKHIGGTFGSISQLYDAQKEDRQTITDFLSTRDHSEFWTSDANRFELFCSHLTSQDFSFGSAKRLELDSLANASSGMNVRSQTHIAYAMKRLAPFPAARLLKEPQGGFAHFCTLYEDIIMSVGVNVQEFYVENRGIFRNPLSVVANDYRGIAMELHRFVCECVRTHCPDVETFRVRPMQKMAEIFMATFENDPQLRINGQHARDYKGDFCHEETFKIPIDSFF